MHFHLTESPVMTRWERILAFISGGILVSLLFTAALLRPSTQGFGTHQQLGLPPCSIRIFFDVRCPACGMTTSWAHAVRGQLPSALKANIGGTLLAALAVIAGPWGVISGIRGRWLWPPPNDLWTATLTIGILLVTLSDWVARLWGNALWGNALWGNAN